MSARNRLASIAGHLSSPSTSAVASTSPVNSHSGPGEKYRDFLIDELFRRGLKDVELSPASWCYEVEYESLLTPDAVMFVADLVRHFDGPVEQMFCQRQVRKLYYDMSGETPDFNPRSSSAHDPSWQVAPLPARLQDRRVDLGDISPANTQLFRRALNSVANGIQADLDDGHCPNWTNQLRALYNMQQFVHGQLKGVPPVASAPVILLRPRAWNMFEHNMVIGGKDVPGPLFDFGLHMFHNGKLLLDDQSGPFFYLPKLEGYSEARLWNEIFVWTQQQLGIPVGSIKACVLVESFMCSFELHEVLYELRDHCIGLNCGMWDYSASFINKFGHRPEFILPDRKTHVTMDKHYLKSYLHLVIKTCHERGCHATGGMAPAVLPSLQEEPQLRRQITENICRAKLKEIQAGADGLLVFDPDLVPPLHELWSKHVTGVNQLHCKRSDVSVTARDLLHLPRGGFTPEGLRYNVTVGILFIDAWLRGEGIVILNGVVEDSATAEISRSQIWQGIRHNCKLEGDGRQITREFVCSEIAAVRDYLIWTRVRNPRDENHIRMSAEILEELVGRRDFPQFITTYLYEHYLLRHRK